MLVALHMVAYGEGNSKNRFEFDHVLFTRFATICKEDGWGTFKICVYYHPYATILQFKRHSPDIEAVRQIKHRKIKASRERVVCNYNIYYNKFVS